MSATHGSIYRLALIAFPRRVRSVYGDEMVAAFSAAYAQRRTLGTAAARRFALRAWVDALRAGLGSRLGRRGVGGGPRGPLQSWGAAARDRLWLELVVDLRLAARSLRATPSFTIAAIAVLALGVGVNGALFTAVRAALVASAPFPEPDRLVVLDLMSASTEREEPPRPFAWSYPKYELLADWSELAAGPIAAYATRDFTLTGEGEPRRITGEVISADYFRVLGVAMGRGTGFDGGDTQRQIVLAHHLWRDRYGSQPMIGETVRLNGEPVTVIGVTPPGFRGLTGRADLWISMDSVPFLVSPSLLENFDGHWLLAIGRLGPGAGVDEVRAQMEVVGDAVQDSFEWTDPTTRQVGGVTPLEEARRNPRARRAVIVVSVAALLVLLIACANLAVLMIARGQARQPELAVRRALGGSRWRVCRGMVVETLLLALAAGVAGLSVAALATRGIARAWPDNFADGSWNMRFVDSTSFRLDAPTMVFTIGLALVAGFAFSLVPALRLTRAGLVAAIRERRTVTSSARNGRRFLVALEIGVALLLTVGAGLMISSLRQLVDVDQGFDSRNLLTFRYTIPRGSPVASEPNRFHDELFARIRSLPDVTSATFDCSAPRDGHCWITGVRRAGERAWDEGTRPRIGVHMIDEHYFATLGIRLLSGRLLEADEGAETPAVAVINTHAARELFPDGDPIGQPIAVGIGLTDEGATAAIVGVVDDVLYDTPAQGAMSELYVLNRQEPDRSVVGIVRTGADPFAALASIRAEVGALDPELPIHGIATVEALSADQVGDTTAVTTLLGVFAALAILLSATGVWGVVANAVSGRSREIGIRMALGARPPQMVSLTLREGATSALAGGVVGALGALALSRLLAALLHEVSPTDPGSFAGSAVVLVVVSLLAAWLPARRAARLDPVRSLRAE